MKLTVVGKGHSRVEKREDGSHRLVHYAPGDVFEGSERELARFRGRLARADSDAPSQRIKTTDAPQQPNIEALRKEAEALGIEVNSQWKEQRLSAEIAKAREAKGDK